MKKFTIFLILPFFIWGCNKSSDSSSSTTTTPTNVVSNGLVSVSGGGYVVAGQLNSINSVCGTTVATITVAYATTNGFTYTQGTTIGTASISAANTFLINVPSSGTYYLTATAGQCSTSAAVGSLKNGDTVYYITLGSSCTSYCYKTLATSDANNSSIGTAYSASGDLEFDPAEIFFTASKAGSFDLNLSPSNGESILNSAPLLGSGWSGTVNTDGTVKVGDTTTDRLYYAAQVDTAGLQFDQGYCDTKDAALDKSASYLQLSGFGQKSIDALKTEWAKAKMAASVCVYPQDASTVAKTIGFVSKSNIQANRVWFAIVDNTNQAATTKKYSEKVAKLLTQKPKKDALAAVKKSPAKRGIASDTSVIADEWALGYVIQK